MPGMSCSHLELFLNRFFFSFSFSTQRPQRTQRWKTQVGELNAHSEGGKEEKKKTCAIAPSVQGDVESEERQKITPGV